MKDMRGLGTALPKRGGGKKAPQEEDEEDDGDYQPTEAERKLIAEALKSNNPALMAALNAKLNSMVGKSSGYLDTLPSKVKRRIEALEVLQEERDKLEEEFQAEVRALEAKYEAMYAPLYAKRTSLVTGATDCEQPSDDTSEAPAGVPDFWLVALSNHEAIGEQIGEKDAAVLSHLVDLSCSPVTGTDKDGDPMYGFELKFVFAEGNPYLTSNVLTKTYLFSDEDQSYLVASKGTAIAWAAGKDPTVKVLKKKGTKPGAKPQTKIERVDSFFNFFSPPDVPEEGDEIDEEEMEALQEALEADHEIGTIIKDDIIPNAVSWFTGAAMQDEEEEEEDDEDGDDEDGDEDEDEEEEEDAPPAKGSKKGGKARPAPRGGAGGDKPEECKQQ